jgi:Cu+-exporting ATPase
VTAQAVARAVGIADFRADVLPADKAEAVRELKARGVVTGMVGDGVNDAPALAAADVSFAIGTGADVAIEAADITLVRNDLGAVVDAIMLSRATLSKIRQNLFFAFAYNVLGIPLAAAGLLNPVIAGAAMAASSVSVVGNALLLRRWRPGP